MYPAIVAILILVIIATFLYYENNKLDITKYELNSKDIVNPVKMVQLSDLHSKPAKNVLNTVKELTPDIIFITGDYINDHEKNKEKMLSYGKELVKTAPVFYITGNHERRLENFDELMSKLKGIGFTVLLDETDDIIINGNKINILGLDENQAGFDDYKARKNGTFKYKDESLLFKELSEKSGYKVVLSHYPENFMAVSENDYSQYDFDIQLSGHAHGGQFILPLIGPVFSPGQGIMPKYAKGSFGERPKLIISRGIGNAEFPFRLFNHPEINVIDIKSKA